MLKSVVVVVLGFVLSLGSLPIMALEKGDKAPQIVGRDIHNQLFALSRLEAKPKVVNLFWVDCKPCKEELPLLAKKEQQFSNVVFAAVHSEINHETETNYTIEDLQAFAKTLSAHPKTLVLGSERVKAQYGVEAFPVSFLMSKDNQIEKVLFGFNERTVNQLEQWLKKQAH